MTAVEIIKKYKIHKTSIREEILDILIQQKRSFTFSELAPLLNCTKSKSSILRTLKFYTGQGLVHTSMAADSKLKYFFGEKQQHCNAYFTCTGCGKSFVFDPPMPVLPGLRNRKILKVDWIISGTCDVCS